MVSDGKPDSVEDAKRNFPEPYATGYTDGYRKAEKAARLGLEEFRALAFREGYNAALRTLDATEPEDRRCSKSHRLLAELCGDIAAVRRDVGAVTAALLAGNEPVLPPVAPPSYEDTWGWLWDDEDEGTDDG